MREIVLDTETTGLDPDTGHRVVEIGCVEMINHIKTGSHFHAYLNPDRDMPQEAERIHGLSSKFLSDKPRFETIACAFLEFIGESPLVIHNAAFDMKFVNAELDRAGHPVLPMNRAIDTVLIARQKFPGQPANLDALCKRFNIDLSARTKHGALLDAELLADVYLELRGGRQEKLVLDAPKAQAATIDHKIRSVDHRSFPPTPEELEEHERMVAGMAKSLWKGAVS